MPKTIAAFRPSFRILALALALLVPAAADAERPHAPTVRALSVSGEGEVKAAPDEAMLSAGVVSRAATADAALADNRQAMNAVFAALKGAGIADKLIQTSHFSVSPEYANEKTGDAPRISFYQVSNSVSVTIDDLTKLGITIDALVASGANSMGSISFSIRDPKPLLAQARAAAVRDAMERARTYAGAAGVALGPVIAISEGGAQAPQPMLRAMSFGNAAAPTPIAAGEESVSAQVSMTFEIR